MNQETVFDTDIVIIGGGIAGCIAATSLAEYYNVTLIDKLTTPKERIGESLAPASQRIFKELNIFQDDEQLDTIYSKTFVMQSYWGSDKVHIVDHLKNPDGFVKKLNRKAFESYLRDNTETKGVTCLWGMRLFSSIYKNKKWKITVKSDDLNNRKTTIIKAKFVIDASGRQAHFAKSIGIKRQVFDHLITCWFTLPNTKENKMSTIIADELGWWYSAVTPDNKRIISFQTDADLVERNTFKNLENFLILAKKEPKIQELIHLQEKNIDFKGTVSANSTKLEQVAGQQWIAIGDAAISFDPLSSQGMFNAMANAMQVKKLLIGFDLITDNNFNLIYTKQIDAIWQHYLNHKKLFYAAENRWKKSTFWKRRV